jgi:hypothetical protein
MSNTCGTHALPYTSTPVALVAALKLRIERPRVVQSRGPTLAILHAMLLDWLK